METKKIGNKDFIRQISKKSGYAQKDIREVLRTEGEVIKENLDNGFATQVLEGMVVYPSTYNNEYMFARARFGRFFRDINSAIL